MARFAQLQVYSGGRILIRIRRNLGSFDFLARLIDRERKGGMFCTIASLFSGGIFALSRLKNSVNEKWFFSSMKISDNQT